MKTLPMAIAFVFFGYQFKNKLLSLVLHKMTWYYCLLGTVIFLILAIYNKTVNIAVPCFNNIVIYFICALLGTVLTLYIASKINSSYILWLGRNSLIIFILNGPISMIVSRILNHYIPPVVPMVNVSDYMAVFVSILVIILYYPAVIIVEPFYNKSLMRVKSYVMK